MRAIGRQILAALALAVTVLATASSAASAGQNLPAQWAPGTVAINQEPGNTFLLRPGQIVVGPGDAADVQRVLTDWRAQPDEHPYGMTLFTRATQNPTDPAREVMAALARVRAATAQRPQGPVQVAPNYVLVGEAVGPSDAITFTGEPRVQGGTGSTARLAKMPPALPARTTSSDDGQGVKIAVLDTGMFDHEWLSSVQVAPNSGDTWDADRNGYADAESGHGTFIAGLILQVAPAASVYAVKVLNSHGVGDDYTVAKAMAQLPPDVNVINLSLGGYTDRDMAPMAIARATHVLGQKNIVVVAAAGNANDTRPFWPAAFEPVLAVGAADDLFGKWDRAPYSNYGPWVDATARGTNLQSTFGRGKTKVAQGRFPSPLDPVITFGGWASWDGTSFSTPIAAAMIARTMSRRGYSSAAEAETELISTSPLSQIAEFPNAVQLDELEK